MLAFITCLRWFFPDFSTVRLRYFLFPYFILSSTKWARSLTHRATWWIVVSLWSLNLGKAWILLVSRYWWNPVGAVVLTASVIQGYENGLTKPLALHKVKCTRKDRKRCFCYYLELYGNSSFSWTLVFPAEVHSPLINPPSTLNFRYFPDQDSPFWKINSNPSIIASNWEVYL